MDTLTNQIPTTPIETLPATPESAALTAATACPSPTVVGTVESLKHWLSAASRFEQGKLFSQVMAGLELKALWKAAGLKHGGDRKGPNSQIGNLIGHEDICTAAGISKTQAYRLMEMADAALPRLKKLPELAGLDLLAMPISSLTDSTAAALETAVRKLTDGKNQQDFFGELGLYKRPAGSKGGAREAGPGKELSEDARKELLIQSARDDFNSIEVTLVTSGAAFTLLDDREVMAQIHVLQGAIEARNRWLRTPKGRRDANAVGAIRAFLDDRHNGGMEKATRGETVGAMPDEEIIDARG
jgi:hypothetical protein